MTETISVAPSLRELLSGFIDYAGLFPPAKLPLNKAWDNFASYRQDKYSWLLRSFVIPAGELNLLSGKSDAIFSVLSSEDIAADACSASSTLESTIPFKSQRVVYCEVAPDNLSMLDEVKASGCFAKIRTGGLKPEAIPSPEALVNFINACASRKLAFKATAGLHHPVRASYALSYEDGAQCAVMHGFLNVLLAAAFAFHGRVDILPIIQETDPQAFSFSEDAGWRGISLSSAQIRQARRNFIHSVGSCSFEEPVHDLQAMGLL